MDKVNKEEVTMTITSRNLKISRWKGILILLTGRADITLQVNFQDFVDKLVNEIEGKLKK